MRLQFNTHSASEGDYPIYWIITTQQSSVNDDSYVMNQCVDR